MTNLNSIPPLSLYLAQLKIAMKNILLRPLMVAHPTIESCGKTVESMSLNFEIILINLKCKLVF